MRIDPRQRLVEIVQRGIVLHVRRNVRLPVGPPGIAFIGKRPQQCDKRGFESFATKVRDPVCGDVGNACLSFRGIEVGIDLGKASSDGCMRE